MATDHNFRIKNGLTVGAVEVIDSSGKLTTAAFGTNSTEKIEDVAAAMITGATHSNITVTYNDTNGTLAFSAAAQYGDSDVESYLDGGTSTPVFSTITSNGQITSSGKLVFSDKGDYIQFGSGGTDISWTAPVIFRESAHLALSDYSGVKLGGYNGTDYGPRVHVKGDGNLSILDGALQIGNTTVIGSDRDFITDDKLTFDYNDHYFQAGTNSVAFKNSGGTSYIVISNTGTSITGDLTVTDFVKASGNNLKFSAGGTHVLNIDLNNHVYPQTHNATDVGFSSSLAFKDAFFSGVGNFGTINTGQGATEVHLMNQNVRTTDGPTFANLTLNGNLDVNGNNIIDVNQINATGDTGWLDFNMDADSVYPQASTDNQTVLGSITHMNFVGDSNGNGTGGIFYWGYGVNKNDSGTFTQTMALDRDGDLGIKGELSVEDGKLTIKEFTGTSNYTQIKKTNTGSNLAIVSQESIYMMLDGNNDQTNRSFQIVKDADAPGSGSAIFIVEENGNVTSYGNVSMDTVNTGQGATEVHLMNQNIRTTDSPTFADLTVTGNLNITGDINSYNVTDLDVTDKTITVGVGGSASANDGAGLVVDGASASILWENSLSQFRINKNIEPQGVYLEDLNGTVASRFGIYGWDNELQFTKRNLSTNVHTGTLMSLDYSNNNAKFAGRLYPSGQATNYVDSTRIANWQTAYGWGNHASAGYLTSFDITSQTDPKYLRSNAADTASELITVQKGISSDGAGKMYSWRAVENTSSSGTVYQRIARISHSQSSRYTIELVGRSTSYGDGSYPSWGKLVGQHNNDNNSDLVFYDFKSGMNSDGSEVVTEIGQVNVDNTTTDIYVKVGSFAELSAFAHMSDGNITPYQSNSSSSSAPSGYSAITKIEMWNSNTDGSGSGLDADTLDGQQLSAIARLDYDNVGEVRATNFKTLNGGTSYFYTSSGNLRGYITAVESTPHLRIATSGNESIGFYDGGPTGTENIRISGSGDLELYQGHLQLDNALELRSKDTGGNVRTIARINNSNVLQYGWSANGHVSFMGGGSYTERMRIDSAGFIQINSHTNSWDGGLRMISQDGSDTFQIHPDNNGYMYVDKNWYFTGDIHVGSIGQKVWHQGNDGANSGLDADLLDGQHGSHYLNYNNFTNTPTIPSTSNFASLSGSNSFTNSYNEFGNNTGAVSNDGSWAARVNISGSAHSRLDLFEGGDNHRLRLYVHQGHAAHIGTISDTDLVIETNGADRIQVHNGGDFEVKHNQYLTGSVDRRIKLGDSGVAGVSTSNNAVYVRGNDDHLILNCAGNGYISFTDNGTEHMRLTDGNLQLDGKIQADGSAGSNFYAIQFSRSGSGTTTPDIWGSNNTLVLGTTASNSVMSLSSGVKIRGFSTTGGQNRDQAIYIGRELGDSDTEYFTMGWKPTARSGEQMQPTGGPYNGGKAFYIEAGSTEAGGICLDQDSVNVYGSSDGGTTFRVIDKDSDIVTFEMLQTSWDGRFKGNVIAYGSMTSISDERIKENIKPIEPVINKIKNLGVYSYNKITAPEIHKDRKEIGVIAQEIQKEFPDLVNEESVNPKETNGLDKILTVDYEHLTAVLLKGMQEQQEQIEELKSIINTLVESK